MWRFAVDHHVWHAAEALETFLLVGMVMRQSMRRPGWTNQSNSYDHGVLLHPHGRTTPNALPTPAGWRCWCANPRLVVRRAGPCSARPGRNTTTG
jgi:hypothetical protein